MSTTQSYVRLFDTNIRRFFGDALRIRLTNPGMALFLTRTLWRQRRAAGMRRSWAEQGVHVPPFMIASVTNRCNLHCKGCYAQAQDRAREPELSTARLSQVIAEAQDLGVSIILLAGGEPLTRPDLLDITARFPGIVFPLFTNGLLLDQAAIAKLRRQRHVVPVLSLEGCAEETDDRRGAGVYRHLTDAMGTLKQAGVFFGTSTTVTTANLRMVASDDYVDMLYRSGCRLFFWIEYVPVQPGTEILELGEEERQWLAQRLEALRRRLPALFVAFPGDEEQYGGCLAAGRGFVHLSPSGRLEPCPFSPYADISVAETPLMEALRSPLLRAIREADGELRETRGGCALWEKRDWVASLLPESMEPAGMPVQET
jgi:MoaA/NifB/PqqE/SkfB family radical SAM enzyme